MNWIENFSIAFIYLILYLFCIYWFGFAIPINSASNTTDAACHDLEIVINSISLDSFVNPLYLQSSIQRSLQGTKTFLHFMLDFQVSYLVHSITSYKKWLQCLVSVVGTSLIEMIQLVDREWIGTMETKLNDIMGRVKNLVGNMNSEIASIQKQIDVIPFQTIKLPILSIPINTQISLPNHTMSFDPTMFDFHQMKDVITNMVEIPFQKLHAEIDSIAIETNLNFELKPNPVSFCHLLPIENLVLEMKQQLLLFKWYRFLVLALFGVCVFIGLCVYYYKKEIHDRRTNNNDTELTHVGDYDCSNHQVVSLYETHVSTTPTTVFNKDFVLSKCTPKQKESIEWYLQYVYRSNLHFVFLFGLIGLLLHVFLYGSCFLISRLLHARFYNDFSEFNSKVNQIITENSGLKELVNEINIKIEKVNVLHIETIQSTLAKSTIQFQNGLIGIMEIVQKEFHLEWLDNVPMLGTILKRFFSCMTGSITDRMHSIETKKLFEIPLVQLSDTIERYQSHIQQLHLPNQLKSMFQSQQMKMDSFFWNQLNYIVQVEQVEMLGRIVSFCWITGISALVFLFGFGFLIIH